MVLAADQDQGNPSVSAAAPEVPVAEGTALELDQSEDADHHLHPDRD